MPERRSLLVVCLALALVSPAVAGAQEQAETLEPVDATVADPVAFDGTTTPATLERTPALTIHWRSAADDEAAFYGTDATHLYYYDDEAGRLHAVERPTGREFVTEGLLVGEYLVPANKSIADFVVPSNEPVRYTDRGTFAVGTTFGPLVYDPGTGRWLSEPEGPIGGYPTITTNPGGIAAAGPYYVTMANTDVLLAPANWTGHVVEPPAGTPSEGAYAHLRSEARVAAFNPKVAKTGYPVVFRGTVGTTDRPPDEVVRVAGNLGGSTRWPVWRPRNDDLSYVAAPRTWGTTVYDGVGSGTVVLSGTRLVAYNVTTGEQEWHRNTSPTWTTRHGDRLYTHTRTLDLETGEMTGIYRNGVESTYLARMGGKQVVGDFEEIESITDDGDYMVLTMSGASKLGQYRARGVRFVDLESGSVAAQRITTGDYQSPWAGQQAGYLADAGDDYAVVVSPADAFGGQAAVLDLRTNETVATLPFEPTRSLRPKVTDDGLVVVPQFSTDRADGGALGRATGNFTVYDPSRETVIGRLPATFERGAQVSTVRVRDGDLYTIARTNGRTEVTRYGGFDESLTVETSIVDGSAVVSVTELDGAAVRNATVTLGDERARTDASGNATVDVPSPDAAGATTYPLTVRAGGRSHETTVRIAFERRSRPAGERDGGEAQGTTETDLSLAPTTPLTALALAGALALVARRRR